MKWIILFFLVTLGIAEEYVICTGDSTDTDVLVAQAIVNEAYREIGVVITFEYYPFTRSLMVTNIGECDAELLRHPVVEKNYPNLVRVPFPIKEINIHAVTAREGRPVTAWSDLNGKLIAFRRGFKMLELMTKEMSVKLIDDISLVPDQLQLGRIDVFLDNYPSPHRSVTFDSTFVISDKPVASALLYHYIHKSNDSLTEPLAGELKKMKENGRFEILIDSIISKLPQNDPEQ